MGMDIPLTCKRNPVENHLNNYIFFLFDKKKSILTMSGIPGIEIKINVTHHCLKL